MDRRDSLKLIALAPLLATPACREAARDQASPGTPAADVFGDYQAEFFTEHEFRTVRMLADMIIPADDRSGSASDAYVPEFIDFTMTDRPELRTPVRGGLNWLDNVCRRRYGQSFADCTDQERTAVVDEIAWPDGAPQEMKRGVAFFNTFRDLVAAGFWSSRIGVEDLQYTGNAALPGWDGCPEEALERLGVKYS